MIKTDDTAIALLNGLIAVNTDAQQGYETAATDVRDPELARKFGEFAAQRMKFVDELSARVKLLRGTPAKTGTLGGTVHRAWMDFRAANDTAQAHAILSECERAEDIAVRAYHEALNAKDVDKESHAIIQRQYEQVQLAHDRVRDLRDSPAYANR